MKETQTPIPWQVAKSKIKEYTTSKWKRKWITAPPYKHTKLFYDSPNKNKLKSISKMGTYMLSTWIKSITGHNNLAYFQSKLNPEIHPTCRLCVQANLGYRRRGHKGQSTWWQLKICSGRLFPMLRQSE